MGATVRAHRLGAVYGSQQRHLLASWCQSLGLPRRRVDELLKTVGLSTLKGRRLGQLSLSMQQRLTLAPQPRLLVLDESDTELNGYIRFATGEQSSEESRKNTWSKLFMCLRH